MCRKVDRRAKEDREKGREKKWGRSRKKWKEEGEGDMWMEAAAGG